MTNSDADRNDNDNNNAEESTDSPLPPVAAAAAAAAAAAPDPSVLLARRLNVLEQLTTLYGFSSAVAHAAVDALTPSTTDGYPLDATLCCQYILEHGLAEDRGGPVVPMDTCPHVASRVRVHQIPAAWLAQPQCQWSPSSSVNGSNTIKNHPSAATKAASRKQELTDEGTCPGRENWLCLTCATIQCSRYENGHALQHWQDTIMTSDKSQSSTHQDNDNAGEKDGGDDDDNNDNNNQNEDHCIAASLSDLSVWCHQCQSYITNPSLRPLLAELERAKFGSKDDNNKDACITAAEPHPKRQRSGTMGDNGGGTTTRSEDDDAAELTAGRSEAEEEKAKVNDHYSNDEEADEEGEEPPPSPAASRDTSDGSSPGGPRQEHAADDDDDSNHSFDDEDDDHLFQMIAQAARAQGIPLQWILAQMHGIPVEIDEGPVEYPFDTLPRTLPAVAEFIRSDRCQRILVLAGAGMSVASGIPDFRSADGLYATLNVNELSCTTEEQRETIRRDPSAALDQHLFLENPLPCLESQREFILGTHQQRWKATLAHRFVELLHHKTNKLVRLYTQNIDGLEDQCLRLPSDKVICVHGSMDRAECAQCEASQDFDRFCSAVETQIKDLTLRDTRAPSESTPIRCTQCDSPAVKPAIVLFHSSLPRVFFENVPSDIENVDLLIVLGTSLKVAPANSLVWRVPRSALRLLVNREIVGEHLGMVFGEESERDVFAEGDIEPVLLDLIEELGWLEDLRDLLDGKLPESSKELLEARFEAAAARATDSEQGPMEAESTLGNN